MDYTTYTPGSMSSTDFYDNLIGDALSGAFNRQDNSVTEDSTPAFTEHYYEGDATPKMGIPTTKLLLQIRIKIKSWGLGKKFG